MQLLDFISLVAKARQPGLPSVAEQLNVDPDYTEVYMKGALALDAELVFLDSEETDLLIYEKEGQRYFSFFSLWQLLEAVDEMLSEKISPEAIAARLLEYRINDA
ncbi:hypothetical protein [Hymenobacter koreensis]|uniref:Uncharacterized protein n=1 Tax=Hymenobacter koreensis TaxID=1084523 RepID=A0ABP8IWL9_9BACT